MQCARDCAILQESNTNWDGGRASGTKLGVTFVDNFLGTPLYVQLDDEVDIDLHEVPYEVYTIQQVKANIPKDDIDVT